MEQPDLGWTTSVKVVRVIDGDTVEVSVTKTFMVRLQDDDDEFNAPEIRRPASDEERKCGQECKRYLYNLLFDTTSGLGMFDDYPKDNVVLHIDTKESGKMASLFTFTRIKGHLFVDGKDVTEDLNKFMKSQGDYE
jgi:hypothetical protein